MTTARALRGLGTGIALALAACSSSGSSSGPGSDPGTDPGTGPGDPGRSDPTSGLEYPCVFTTIEGEIQWWSVMPSGQIEWADDSSFYRTRCETGESVKVASRPFELRSPFPVDEGWVVRRADGNVWADEFAWLDHDFRLVAKRSIEPGQVPAPGFAVARDGAVFVRRQIDGQPTAPDLHRPEGATPFPIELPETSHPIFFESPTDFVLASGNFDETWTRYTAGVAGTPTAVPPNGFDEAINGYRRKYYTRDRAHFVESTTVTAEVPVAEETIRVRAFDGDGKETFRSEDIALTASRPHSAYYMGSWVVTAPSGAVFLGLRPIGTTHEVTIHGVPGITKALKSHSAISDSAIIKFDRNGKVQKGDRFERPIYALGSGEEKMDAHGRLFARQQNNDGPDRVLGFDEDLRPLEPPPAASAASKAACAGAYGDDGITNGQDLSFCESAYYYTCIAPAPAGAAHSCGLLKKLSDESYAKCPYCR